MGKYLVNLVKDKKVSKPAVPLPPPPKEDMQAPVDGAATNGNAEAAAAEISLPLTPAPKDGSVAAAEGKKS